MTLRATTWLLVVGAAACVPAILAFQREFRVYQSLEGYDNIPLPEDYKVPGEWVFAQADVSRASARAVQMPYRFGGGIDWREGGTSWTQDYPRADRHFAMRCGG